MGGDRGADIVVPAAIEMLKKYPNLNLILVGQQSVINKKLQRRRAKSHDRITVVHAEEIVGMDEPPATALRFKKDSSMRVAINLVKENIAQACVSAGNTGALLATARFVLKTLPGIDRPAIIGMLPARNKEGYVRMLDLGANIKATEEHLFQFAVMGSVLTKAIEGIKSPRVALLNIGEEEIKGHEEIKAAAVMLHANSEINYIGYVEGNDIFSDMADVIVCDGFAGNVALKSIEGLANFIRSVIYKAVKKNIWTKLLALIAAPVFKIVRVDINPANYNGASFVGLRGSVIKSHGGTTVSGFMRAIERAMLEIEYNVPKLISDEVAKLLKQSEDA
ncbi:MAG: phosphate acyltransferase [Gammaproteobacteria bacterium RIFCSPHIGHO2_12_FULL_35_23]|nr:MAG: phosphate acyltransferase [Gammaproteobacteria bacterium RIFCSPHIGHO2_12_FULL_35_23]